MSKLYDVIDKFICEKMKDIVDGQRKWGFIEIARRINIEIINNLPENELEKLGLQEVKNLTEKELNEYKDNNHPKLSSDLSTIKRNDNTTIQIKNPITHGQVGNYINGISTVPFPVLIAFCKVFNLSLEGFMVDVYKKMNLAWESITGNSPTDKVLATKSFMKSVLGGSYSFDTDNKNHLMNLLFPKDKDRFVLNFINLPTKNEYGYKDFQQGTIEFIKDNGICRLQGTMEDSTGDVGDLEGFSVIINPAEEKGTCWCFLKRSDNRFAAFTTICFRLRNEEGNNWYTRIAEVVDVRKIDSKPIIYRMLLWKETEKNILVKEDIEYFLGHIKLNTDQFFIPTQDLEYTKKYLFSVIHNQSMDDIPREKLTKLQEHFKNFDIEAIRNAYNDFEILGNDDSYELTVINFMGNSKERITNNMTILSQNPFLDSWLRKIVISNNYNIILPELDKRMDNLFIELMNRKSKEKMQK